MSEQYYNFVKRHTKRPQPPKSGPDVITWQEAAELNRHFEPGEPDCTLYPGA